VACGGKRENRQNSFDDFIAANRMAAFTRAFRSWPIAIGGGSMPACWSASRHSTPDLFRADLPWAPARHEQVYFFDLQRVGR